MATPPAAPGSKRGRGSPTLSRGGRPSTLWQAPQSYLVAMGGGPVVVQGGRLPTVWKLWQMGSPPPLGGGGPIICIGLLCHPTRCSGYAKREKKQMEQKMKSNSPPPPFDRTQFSLSLEATWYYVCVGGRGDSSLIFRAFYGSTRQPTSRRPGWFVTRLDPIRESLIPPHSTRDVSDTV